MRWITLLIVLTFVGSVILLRSFVETPWFRRLMLTTRQQPGKGAPPAPTGETPDDLVGAGGVAESALRPSGHATIGGRYLNVVADGEHVAAGSPIRVVAVDGLRGIVVRGA